MTYANVRRCFVIAVVFLSAALLVAQNDGPRGVLRIKGISGHDSVFLNGTSQDYFVGSVDQAKQGLLLPPGQQHVIIVNPDGNRQVYSGYVNIVAGQQATLRVDKSSVSYGKWAKGDAQLSALPSVPPATVTIQPVSGQITAYPGQANCGQQVRLVWNSNGYNTLLKYNGKAIAQGGQSGEHVVDPKQTTTYQLETFGPGGVAIVPVTVYVNNAVKTSLSAVPAVVRYHRVGDQVIDPGTATLNWSATNAQKVVLDPIGPVSGASGQQVIDFTPGTADVGPVSQTLAYKITASNECGGADSTTALVQVAGSIDPPIPPEVLPPVLPQTGSPLPLIGLVGLSSLAASFLLRRIRKG